MSGSPMRKAGAVIIAFLVGTVVGVGLAAATHSGTQATASGTSSPSAQAAPSNSTSPAVQMTSSVTTMNVNEGDMFLRPAADTTVGAGTITFSVTNEGAIHHEFVIVSGDPTGTVGDEKGTVSEENHIGGPDGPEIGDLHPGQTKTMTATLPPGTYTAMCNYPGHYAAGMHFQFTVSPPIAVMNVTEGDMYLTPGSTTLPAGTLTFSVTNQGAIHHEFVIVSGDPTGTVGDEKGTVSEENHIGGPDGPEIGDLHPGQTKTMTATLPPGTYTAMCNYPGHYAAGMHFQFTVK